MTTTTDILVPPATAGAALRRVNTVHFCPWAGRLQDGDAFLRSLPGLDLSSRVSDPRDPGLMRMARLDCDWHGENVRSLSAMKSDGIDFLPVKAVGIAGMVDFLASAKSRAWGGVETWFVITGQHPQMLGDSAPALLAACVRHGVRVLYYAFDEASRNMACMASIAPHLSVFIHDESPLAPQVAKALPPGCKVIHRSWVANLVPFAAPFCPEPDGKIVFLGSKLGLTPHRKRQISFLSDRFKDRFVAICDHSLSVGERLDLGRRFKASVCPEGRMFATDAMGGTHTDRPFWSGCLGMVPVSEDSRRGGRLENLHREKLILRYPHANLKSLAETCETALAATQADRLRIYDHFNRSETVGSVVAAAIKSAI